MACVGSDKIGWDVTRLADRVKNTRPRADGKTPLEDAKLAKFFENPQLGDLVIPATILDRHGCIILWYLPYIFSPRRVVRVFFFLSFFYPNSGPELRICLG